MRARSANGRGAPRAWLVALAVLVTLLGSPVRAYAHPTPGSVAFVDFTVDGARIEQDVPIEELERALHMTLAEPGQTPAEMVQGHVDFLRTYAAAHVVATALDGGTPWAVDVLDVTGHAATDGPRATFRLALHAPTGRAAGSLRLHDDLIAHEVVSHYTTVFVRSDWTAGVRAGDGIRREPRLVGTLHAGHDDVTMERSGGFWRGFRSVVALGGEHIATGTDHLLFLFALVLVAPLASVGGRWRGRRGTREALVALARVVTAFTVGHSITLALGAFGLVAIPTFVVEAAIALSILVTAIHALRPLFPRREAVVAGVFGLVHGLAFASTLVGRDLGRAQAAWTLLGFNTGIELAQVGLLTLVVPWLLLAAPTRAYDAFRVVGGSVAAVLAAGWLVERTAGTANPTAPLVVWMEAHPLPLLAALAAGSIVARAAERHAAPTRVRSA